MKTVRITLTEIAAADVLEQAEWYEAQSDPKLAMRWEGAVTSTILRISRRPSAGAPCSFESAELQGTRRVAVTGFPKHLVFYQSRGNEVVVLRIVHGARDLESLLSV